MYFKTLPKHVKEAIAKLPKDKEFQKTFAEDKILDQLEEDARQLNESLPEIMLMDDQQVFIERQTV